MLYFIKSQNFLKIGYSQDMESYKKRLKSYRTHNPDFVVLDTVENGTLKDENTLHKLLEDYQYYTEWFYDCPEVHKCWNQYIKSIRKETQTVSETPKIFLTNIGERIKEDVYNYFGDNYITNSYEIYSVLSDIYRNYNKIFYKDIKTLNKLGYSFRRFKKNGEMLYELTKTT